MPSLAALLLPWLVAFAGGDGISWVGLEEAMDANGKKRSARPVLVDVYTDWCGWCKRQDATTFQDPRVTAYLEEHYHAVRFDAEGGQTVTWKGEELGRRGKTHEWALRMATQRGRIGYPTLVILSPEGESLAVLPGYHTAEKLLPYLVYYAEGYHEDLDFATFQGLYTVPEPTR
jgi:thioredoxin-related protein